MKSQKLTRHLLSDGQARMNVLLDRKLDVGFRVTLVEEPDTVWTVEHRFETLDRMSVKRGWNNNI